MNIVVGVSGGIAAYKVVHLVRLLIGDGHEVHVVPTEDALRFVGRPTWESLSRNPVTTSVHDDVPRVRHVALGQNADLVIVAPATANTLASMAAGLASDLLGTTLLATKAPVLVAPAMHTEMWLHAATQANMATLRSRGVHVVGPDDGPLTGGDSGPGRMSEPEAIYEAALALAGRRRDLEGVTLAVSAGGTREPIDPVRFIGNRSSGKQGVAIAVAAAERGARVLLAATNVEADVLRPAQRPGVEITTAGSAAELAGVMRSLAAEADVVIMAAAVADFRVAEVSEGKLTKEVGGVPSLTLVENEDIVAGLAAGRRDGQTIVAFAAETGDDYLERGRRKRQKKGVDLLAVNQVGWDKGFETSHNTLYVLDARDEVVKEASGSKREVADALLDVLTDQAVGQAS
ncbi:bifunctional phosphopantothenoylcysteine decarboxylase/phosphopantothenate--cysteine ligase CoaBC [Tessaracoccus sp. Y36]|uniref:bifunctional phosphopantothenoylcysteine decarboxylase/phosphopantothenate--cysteine ligase CoaBC n=1 Tax=Tessaracoccus sp. MC1756 TaxID=2760311 RepID=UPI0015FEF174|nr:bifunctional phosphopantothenoylcysteine decarboxylase/phosphopantothenate--cysteine ligase CoaBC [Tessaracoccus sp. MC1756]MBB1508787.1 bifunctional phosphopantothenoylcysteine decarboxylase/phosphopantothenate--cysteine ligase CoaBC [Tessaracoccus sp. MC1756]